MGKTNDISVVVPVFNSSATLSELFDRIQAIMESMQLDFEVIFVDDHSGDSSWEVIGNLKKRHGIRVRGIQLARNAGQQAATFCGLQEAGGKWIVTLDDDLQYPPEEIRTLWNAGQSQQSDITYGVGSGTRQGILRKLGSKWFRALIRRTALRYPSGSSFRLIRGSILEDLPQPIWKWSYVDPVLAWLSSSIILVPVTLIHRKHGKSGYSLFKLAGIAINILIIYSTLLLQVMIVIGFLTAVISLLTGIYFLIQKLTVGSAMGFSAIIVTVTFVSGVILTSLGILGVYLDKIYRMSSGEPAFLVKRRIE